MVDKIIVNGKQGPIEFYSFDGSSAVELPTEEAVAEFERRAGYELPVPYKQFLLKLNGGKVFPRGFRYEFSAEARAILERCLDPWDEILAENETLFRYFNAVNHSMDGLDLAELQNTVQRWGRDDLFGIGKTVSGDVVVLDLQPGADNGSVKYMTIHGVASLEDDEVVPLAFVAPDFETFCRSFFDYDEEVERLALQAHRYGKQ